jgi:hypothetical protein
VPVADWLPEPIVQTHHEVTVPLEPERALAHALSVPVAPDRTVRALLRLRGLPSDLTIGAFASTPPFVVLRHSRTELVAGIGAPVWRPGGREVAARLRNAGEWPGWSEPGTVRAAVTFIARGDPQRGFSRLITETAVQPTDEDATRAFRRYWLVVGPFSKLIRRRWLRAIRLRALRIA